MGRKKGLVGRLFASLVRRERARAQRRRLSFETLESRSLLSITISGFATVGQGKNAMPIREADATISVETLSGEVSLPCHTDANGFYSVSDPTADGTNATFDFEIQTGYSSVPYQVLQEFRGQHT
jgi:hypothetical protein